MPQTKEEKNKYYREQHAKNMKDPKFRKGKNKHQRECSARMSKITNENEEKGAYIEEHNKEWYGKCVKTLPVTIELAPNEQQLPVLENGEVVIYSEEEQIIPLDLSNKIEVRAVEPLGCNKIRRPWLC